MHPRWHAIGPHRCRRESAETILLDKSHWYSRTELMEHSYALPIGDLVSVAVPERSRQNEYPVKERPHHRDQGAENREGEDEHCNAASRLADIEAMHTEAA